MASVDPFVYPIPKDVTPEMRRYLEYLTKWAHQVWRRTGGSEDFIEDNEVTLVSNDGGNRTDRYLKDDIENLWSHINEVKSKDFTDEIYELNAKISELKPARNDRDEIDHLQNQLAEVKRQNRAIEQLVHDIIEQVDTGK